jgi:hypothetical protein
MYPGRDGGGTEDGLELCSISFSLAGLTGQIHVQQDGMRGSPALEPRRHLRRGASMPAICSAFHLSPKQ